MTNEATPTKLVVTIASGNDGERLMQALTALGQEVEIVVSPSNRRAARIRVAA